MEDIKQAIKWWNSLATQDLDENVDTKSGYCKKYYPEKTDCNNLAGGEIMHIWLEEQKKKIIISDKKVIEYNSKAMADTQQLLSAASSDNFYRTCDAHEKLGGDFDKALNSLCFDKGRVIWIQLEVEDSFLSSMLSDWLFTKSRHDDKPMHALGCSVKEIMFSKPNGYSDMEKQAIKKLYDSAFGEKNNEE